MFLWSVPGPCSGNIVRFFSIAHCQMFGKVNLKIKVKLTLDQATKSQRVSSRLVLYSFFNLGARWRLVVNAKPLGNTRYPLHSRLVVSQSCSGRVRKMPPPHPPRGFYPRIVHPAASRYTDCACDKVVTYVVKLDKRSLRLVESTFATVCGNFWHLLADIETCMVSSVV